MNISTNFNVGDLTSYIENEDVGNEDLRANPLQGREIDAEQVSKSNLLNDINTFVQIRPMMTYRNGAQARGPLKSLLT